MASEEQIKVIIGQTVELFEERDELSLLEHAIPRITDEAAEPWDWSHLATEIVDTFRHCITDPRDEGSLDLDCLQDRFAEIESLPKDWLAEGHPMFVHLEEFIVEQRELSYLFDRFGDLIGDEGYGFLHPASYSNLGEHVLMVVCDRSGLDVENLDPTLRASIDIAELVNRFRADGGVLHGVELGGTMWYLGY